MTLALLTTGLRRAARQPRLLVALWLSNLVLAAAAAAPAFLLLQDVLARAPEGDGLLDGFRIGLFLELTRTDARFGQAFSLAVGAALVAWLPNVLTSGGVLEVLTTDDGRSFLHRFGGGAVRFFWRFFRAGAAAAVVIALPSAIVVGASRALSRRLQDAAWPPTDVALGLGTLGLVLLIVVTALIALDVARIRIAREDANRPIRLYASSLRFVLRHPVATVGLWTGNSLLFGLVLVAYAAFRNGVPAASWAGIFLMLAAQQAVMLVRAGLRVALYGSEMALLDRLAS